MSTLSFTEMTTQAIVPSSHHPGGLVITTATSKKHRINREIVAEQIRLSGLNNEPLGIMPLEEALRLSSEADVDLVEIAPTALPPVCRLMDYGKFKYQEQKREHDAKLKQKVITIKEIKFRPATDEGDYKLKLRNIVRFLEDGDHAKVTLRFRGREMAHQNIGMQMLTRLQGDVADIAKVIQYPKMEGRQLTMLLTPK
jgi:translation initiation factor IF-3